MELSTAGLGNCMAGGRGSGGGPSYCCVNAGGGGRAANPPMKGPPGAELLCRCCGAYT